MKVDEATQNNWLSTRVFRALRRDATLTDDELATRLGHPVARIKKVRAELERMAAKHKQPAEH